MASSPCTQYKQYKHHKQHALKVRETYHSYQLQNNKARTPIGEIHLKGHWLIEAGFAINTPVIVRVMEGCIVVTPKE